MSICQSRFSINLGMKKQGGARRNPFIRDVNNNNSKQTPGYWPRRNKSFHLHFLCTDSDSPPPRLTWLTDEDTARWQAVKVPNGRWADLDHHRWLVYFSSPVKRRRSCSFICLPFLFLFINSHYSSARLNYAKDWVEAGIKLPLSQGYPSMEGWYDVGVQHRMHTAYSSSPYEVQKRVLVLGFEAIGLNCRTGLPNGEARTHDWLSLTLYSRLVLLSSDRQKNKWKKKRGEFVCQHIAQEPVARRTLHMQMKMEKMGLYWTVIVCSVGGTRHEHLPQNRLNCPPVSVLCTLYYACM